jgi:hypothetical protein
MFPGGGFMKSCARIFLAGTLALTLAACSDEQTAGTPPPPAAEPPVAVEPAPPATGQDAEAAAERQRALDKLRDGANSIAEGAGTLLNQGRDAAGRALEDAGPALQRAEEYTRELGRIARGAAEQAAADLRTAAEQLTRRIEESQGGIDVTTGDPQALLPAADRLNADTLAAARARPAGVGPDYVGVWAGAAAQCAGIDQEPVEQMAVITPTTIRRYESVCNIDGTPMTDGTATLAASCIAEGDTEDRQIRLSLPSPDRLEIGSSDAAASTTLVRCHLGG